MRRLRLELRWWGLYAVALFMIAAIVFDAESQLSNTWQMILLGLIAVITCVLACRWTERNYVRLE